MTKRLFKIGVECDPDRLTHPVLGIGKCLGDTSVSYRHLRKRKSHFR